MLRQKEDKENSQYYDMQKQRQRASRKRQFKYFYGRSAILIAGLLWIATALSVYTGNKESVAAFRQENTSYPNVCIEAYGNYGIVYMNKNARQIILKDMAERIGIDNYEITANRSDNKETVTLSQKGANGDVECQIITTEEMENNLVVHASQDFRICMYLYNHADSAQDYAEIIEEIFDDYDIKPKMSIRYYA